MMKAKSCECSGKSKCIVITIETCCKKSAHEKKSHDKIKGTPSERSVKRVTSGPIVTERSSSNISADKILAKKSSSKISTLEEPSAPDEPIIHEELPEVPEPKASKHVHQRVFKLPLVTERHHGAGCAMEISVLEKHEDSCMYKKEEVEGRNPLDDKSGSYDCIGRMVFRTCNSTETESDSDRSTFHGGSTGEKPVVAVLPPREENVSLTNTRNRKSEKSLKGEKKSDKSLKHDKNLKSDKSLKSVKSKGEVEEEAVRVKSVTPLESIPSRRNSERKHYYGDGCKLNHRKDPYFSLAQHSEEGSITSKGSASKALQTEKVSLILSSEDILVSLTDVSKGDEKRRPSFLGSIFRTKR